MTALLPSMDDVDENHRTRIRAALDAFSKEVEEQNITIIHSKARKLLNKAVPLHKNRETADKYKMAVFAMEVLNPGLNSGEAVEGLPLSPRDLLEDSWRERLSQRISGSGLSDTSPDVEKRLRWFSQIGEAIQDLGLSGESRPPSLPSPLIYLSTLVDRIYGPGLPAWRFINQIDFVSSTSTLGSSGWTVRDCVIVPPPTLDDMNDYVAANLYFVWQAWKKAVAIKIGSALFDPAGTFALYCRRLRDDEKEELDYGYDDDDKVIREEEKDGDYDWKWRYGTHDGEWHGTLCDSVECFLVWYAHWKEPNKSDI